MTRIAKKEVKSNGSRLAGVFSRLLARLNYDEEEMMEKMGGCRLYRWVFISQASSLIIQYLKVFETKSDISSKCLSVLPSSV